MKTKNNKPRRANGEGSIALRKDGRYQYSVAIGTNADGSFKRKFFYGKTPTEARNKYKKYLKDNPIPLEKVKTVGEYAENWLPTYKKGKVTNGTYYEYELIVNNVIVPVIGKIKFPELRRTHIEAMMRSVSKFSVSRQRKVIFLTKAIIDAAIEDHFCRENPAAKVTAPKAIQKEIEIYKPNEIQAIGESNDPFLPYVALLLLTGMRRGELLALSWRNVDFDDGVIHVKQALSDGEIKDKTKGKRDRLIPIYPELKAVLEMIPKTGFTVVTSDGTRPMTIGQFRYRYKRFIKSTGIEYKSPHKCRHSIATYMIKSGMPVPVVQGNLGHASVTMTEKYTHVSTEDFKNNIVKLKI
jgi:integrase